MKSSLFHVILLLGLCSVTWDCVSQCVYCLLCVYELLEPYPVSKICLWVIRLLPWNVSVLNFTVFFGCLVCMILKHRPLQWQSARRHISKLLHITSVLKVITRLYGVITRKTTVLFTGQTHRVLKVFVQRSIPKLRKLHNVYNILAAFLQA